MKKLTVILVLCLLLSPAALCEPSSAEDFLGGLGRGLDSIFVMTEEAGRAVSQWADDSGVADWLDEAGRTVSAWADESGLAEWAQGALDDISAWADDSGLNTWAENVSAETRRFLEHNRPAVEAWLKEAGEEAAAAWNTLVDPQGHTKEEVQDALQTVVDALDHDRAGGFTYEHDPRDNPNAMKDIVVNPDAVYGFSPSPDSTRLKEFVDAIDWTDPEQVAQARAQRQAYHDSLSELYRMIEAMLTEAKPVEEIARAVSARRNELRLEACADDPAELERVKKSNLETYGNEMGPTADALYEKYGSWQTVLERALGTNAGMDACLGFYDEYYDFYDIGE